jgi:two-component system, chemotaxis family, protein-glutamate methylesterase/glutaminase
VKGKPATPRCGVLVAERSGALTARLVEQFSDEMIVLAPPVSPRLVPEAVRRLKPDVLLVEVAGSLEEISRAIEVVMADTPTPILLATSSDVAARQAMVLVGAGALQTIDVSTQAGLGQVEAQLKLLARVPVVKHPKGMRRRSQRLLFRPPFPLVAIAASLGGPKALAAVLSGLPRSFAAPVVVCQHISDGFAEELAKWLTHETHRVVHEAHDGQHLVPGEVYVAPTQRHLAVQGVTLKLDDGPSEGGFKPSCDVLLASAALSFSTRCVGVVLTGMGRDGAKGLKEIRTRGGHTIAQDEASSAVWGMPREAIGLGAAELVLALPDIAAQLGRWVS